MDTKAKSIKNFLDLAEIIHRKVRKFHGAYSINTRSQILGIKSAEVILLYTVSRAWCMHPISILSFITLKLSNRYKKTYIFLLLSTPTCTKDMNYFFCCLLYNINIRSVLFMLLTTPTGTKDQNYLYCYPL